MRVLVACECSGIVRDAFAAAGHEAMSCDLKADESGNGATVNPYQGDVFKVLEQMPGQFDLMIAHPPCTYLCSSGLHWNGRVEGRHQRTTDALEFSRALWESSIRRICIENPIGALSRVLGTPTQIIQPYQYGEDASKRTALWLRGLPPLRPTGFVEPRYVGGLPRWANQTDSGQNRLGPSPTRAAERARTYRGIAAAMAAQWGMA